MGRPFRGAVIRNRSSQSAPEPSAATATRAAARQRTRTTARAFFVADRIQTSGLERGDVLATTPLAFRVNDNGVAILFRYGVVVLIGLNALEEDEFLRRLASRA